MAIAGIYAIIATMKRVWIILSTGAVAGWAAVMPVAGQSGTALCAALARADATGAASLAIASPSPTECQQTTGASGHCHWRFEYRDGAAHNVFDALRSDIQACPGLIAVPAPETSVNHPDSYLQSQFTGAGRVVSVSVKDKAGHGATYVFLRVSPDRE